MSRQDLASEIKLLNCLFLSSWVLLARIVCTTQFLTWQSNTMLNSHSVHCSSLPAGCEVWACWGCCSCCPAGTAHKSAGLSIPPTHRSASARLLSAPALPPRGGGGAGSGLKRGEIIIRASTVSFSSSGHGWECWLSRGQAVVSHYYCYLFNTKHSHYCLIIYTMINWCNQLRLW